MRQAVGDPLAAFSGLVKWILGAEKLGHTGQKRKALSCQQGSGAVLAIEAGELRLVIEEFQLAGCASHMKINDALGARSELRRQNRQRGLGITLQVKTKRTARCRLFAKGRERRERA